MPVFAWQSFLRRKSIHYITEGKNVKAGCLNIRCPLCGTADPSQHLGIDPVTGYWACWRNYAHRGKSPERLLVALLHCTWDEAKRIAGDDDQTEGTSLDNLQTAIGNLFGGSSAKPIADLPTVELDRSFVPVCESPWQVFGDYLRTDRRFGRIDVRRVVKRYNLFCATSGHFRQRLIIPFYVNQKLVGWTGRAIGPANLRYLTYPASGHVKDIIYNYDNTQAGGPTLVITEGPFDCMKIDYYGQPHGVSAVGVLGVSVTPRQIATLGQLARRFDKVVCLFDEDALGQSFRFAERLGKPVAIGQLPDGSHDPGELKPRQVNELLASPLYV